MYKKRGYKRREYKIRLINIRTSKMVDNGKEFEKKEEAKKYIQSVKAEMLSNGWIVTLWKRKGYCGVERVRLNEQ